MSTITIENGRTAAAPVTGRLWNIVRLHVANPVPTLVVPWVITLAIFAINLAIWLMVVQAAGGTDNLEDDAFIYSGGVTWILFFMISVAAQTMNLNFRFALGFSVTRRDFYLGSSLYFVLLSLLYGTGLTALAALEGATGGWGIGAAFFAPWGMADLPLLTLWAIYVLVMLLFFFLGAAVATMWVRWKAYGLYAFFIAFAVVLIAAAWVITATSNWTAVGEFLTERSLLQLAALTLPLTAVSAVFGYFCLRRATPKA